MAGLTRVGQGEKAESSAICCLLLSVVNGPGMMGTYEDRDIYDIKYHDT